jgi:hypothetical protein
MDGEAGWVARTEHQWPTRRRQFPRRRPARRRCPASSHLTGRRGWLSSATGPRWTPCACPCVAGTAPGTWCARFFFFFHVSCNLRPLPFFSSHPLTPTTHKHLPGLPLARGQGRRPGRLRVRRQLQLPGGGAPGLRGRGAGAVRDAPPRLLAPPGRPGDGPGAQLCPGDGRLRGGADRGERWLCLLVSREGMVGLLHPFLHISHTRKK